MCPKCCEKDTILNSVLCNLEHLCELMEVFSACIEKEQSLEQWSPAQGSQTTVIVGIRKLQVESTAKGKAKLAHCPLAWGTDLQQNIQPNP